MPSSCSTVASSFCCFLLAHLDSFHHFVWKVNGIPAATICWTLLFAWRGVLDWWELSPTQNQCIFVWRWLQPQQLQEEQMLNQMSSSLNSQHGLNQGYPTPQVAAEALGCQLAITGEEASFCWATSMKSRQFIATEAAEVTPKGSLVGESSPKWP